MLGVALAALLEGGRQDQLLRNTLLVSYCINSHGSKQLTARFRDLKLPRNKSSSLRGTNKCMHSIPPKANANANRQAAYIMPPTHRYV